MSIPLPGISVSLFDQSSIPQGSSGILAAGIVIQALKGHIGQVDLITSQSDLLSTYTYAGTVKPTDDPTFFTALNILTQTGQLYVARAASVANPPLYGGIIVKGENTLGNITSMTTHTIVVNGDVTTLGLQSGTDSAGTFLRVSGSPLDGRYTVASIAVVNGVSTITVDETISEAYTHAVNTAYPVLFLTRQPIPFNEQVIGAITDISTSNNENVFKLDGDLISFLPSGDKITVEGSTNGVNDGVYTIVSSVYDNLNLVTNVTVVEAIPSTSPADMGSIFRGSIVDPNAYEFQPEDLFIITGVDPGSYNANIEVKIISSTESPSLLTESGVMQIVIYDSVTNNQLEQPYMCNRTLGSKSVNGNSLFITDVINGASNFIQVINNAANTNPNTLPCDTYEIISNATVNVVGMAGGFDGGAVVSSDLVAALTLFEDKVIPIDVMANGTGPLYENAIYQNALINLAAEIRQDIVVFLNSRATDENLATNSAKASAIATYKKALVSSTSFYGAMYTPHVNITDIFNSRQIQVGADYEAIPGWLGVLNSVSYPYAWAGYTYGSVNNTANWKIGPQSGEAQVLNNASVNFLAYDPVEGDYLAWTQNTLQIANSAMRNLGAVFNVLDIKRNLANYLKGYLQLPITSQLRQTISTVVNSYLNTLQSLNRISGFNFRDITSTTDISDNKLRFVLTLTPAYYAQQIYLVMNIVNATFNFQILQSI